MRIRVLGCGASSGTPLIFGQWGACDRNDPRNNRTRCCMALDIAEQTWLIDVSPDIRQQCLREGIQRIDGVLCTHAHFDHIGGLDDLKPFAMSQKSVIPFYSDDTTLTALQERCPYAFGKEWVDVTRPYRAFIRPIWIDGPFTIVQDVTVIPFLQDHRYSHSLGFRFSNWAYSTDVWQLDEAAFSKLQHLDLWMVDCLGIDPQPHWSHSHLERTLSWIDKVQPKKAILIHMSCQVDYEKFSRMLPPHVTAAYDGMVIDI